MEKHVLHSLAIAKIISFKEGMQVLDVGTGGGFPGIPLAIMFPQTEFLLVDSIGKKIKVVNEIVQGLELKNVVAEHKRVEQINDHFDFVTCRAVTRFSNFIPWVKGKISQNHFHDLKNGILALKGGDLDEELAEIRMKYKSFDLSNFFEEEFFETKKVVHIPFH